MKQSLEMRSIVKRFPGVVANNRVNLSLRAGEIHALLGENGAGKSTLMQILYGFHSMDSGEIWMDGKQIHLGSPKDAIALGIGMVHQEFMLVRPFSVVENTVLGLREGRGPLLDLEQASRKLQELSNRHGLALDPAAKVGALPIGVRQRVEILKLLYRDASLLILDEPTAVLTPPEKDRLFSILRKLKQDGRSVVIVTHKLKEIMECADRVTIMRDGQVVATREIAGTSEQELTRLMVGRDVNLRANKPEQKSGAAVLQVKNLRVEDASGREKVRGLSFDVHAGEILGVAGVDGNGQSELAEALLHLRKIKSGQVILNGADLTNRSVAEHRAGGISYVPADRRRVGSVPEMSVADNAILGLQRKYARGLLRDLGAARKSAEELATRFGIRGSGIDQWAGKLSGGNLQKLILGREIMRGSAALVVEQPTRGLDVGAVESVWRELILARAEGKAILLISAELDELLNLADRIAVIFEGRIMGIVDASAASVNEIGLMMAGIRPAGLASAGEPMKEAPHGEITIERRLAPVDSHAAILATTSAAFLAAMIAAAFLFVSYGASPFQAYYALFHEPFATLRGFGYSLVRASPLALIALGTIVSWRSGFSYLGFEGCFVIGAAAAGWVALLTAPGAAIGPIPFLFFLPLAVLAAFVAGGAWAGIVGLVRARLGGNEVLISLMSNYVAIFLLQYLVSGPLRAPGSLPETILFPRRTWLPFILPGTRAHAGILIAIVAAALVWMLLKKMPLGYELIVTGFSQSAARFAGIDVERRVLLAAFFAGGLGGVAGLTEVLGSQHRLMDGISGGVGFVGIVVALLARLNPLAVVPTALLYGGMSVGADAMQRRASIPSSITFILQSLAVLLVLAFDVLRYYKINFNSRGGTSPTPAVQVSE